MDAIQNLGRQWTILYMRKVRDYIFRGFFVGLSVRLNTLCKRSVVHINAFVSCGSFMGLHSERIKQTNTYIRCVYICVVCRKTKTLNVV